MRNLFLLVFISSVFLSANKCLGQNLFNHRLIVKDTTPVELLEFKMRQEVFMNNYGLDDTSRALINMFFRKRKMSFLECCGVPSGNLVVTVLLFDASSREIKKTGEGGPGGTLLLGGLLTGLAGFIIIPVDGLVNNITYSRKKLLYTLVSRERGIPVPGKILAELTPKDFRK